MLDNSRFRRIISPLMANSKSAEKRARTASRRREINRRQLSKARTASRSLNLMAKDGKVEEATKSFPVAQSIIDKAVKTGSLNKRKASRMKSRMAHSISSKSDG